MLCERSTAELSRDRAEKEGRDGMFPRGAFGAPFDDIGHCFITGYKILVDFTLILHGKKVG